MDPLPHLDRTLGGRIRPATRPTWSAGCTACGASRSTHCARRICASSWHKASHCRTSCRSASVCCSRSRCWTRRFYEGDLLLAAVTAPASAWAGLPDLAVRLREVIGQLPEASLAELPCGAAEDLVRFAGRTP